MSKVYENELDYYVAQSDISDPGAYASLFVDLPKDIVELCRIVQGAMLHVFWAERYGVTLPEGRAQAVTLRHVERLLARHQEIEQTPLHEARSLEKRLVGNCRTFSVLLCAMLRHVGIPARVRCGFGRYFLPDHFEDHWVCEYWHETENRWVMVDAQLDAFQCEVLKIPFDPVDVPQDQFIVGGKAWHWCRSGQEDPEKFGIFDMHGLWFVRGDFVRDVAALNKEPLLPWDCWGLINRKDDDISAAEWELLDQVAKLTFDEVDFLAIRAIYGEKDGLAVPAVVTSYPGNDPIQIEVATGKVVGQAVGVV